MNLPKTYDPKSVEEKIYRTWEKSGYFNPDKLPNQSKRKRKYSIVIPPPNITGSLHMGHALNTTIQDILVRWKRMQGYKALWLPGTDHAGIATQNVVEKELKKQGLTRHDLGRDEFLKRVWKWKKKYGNLILEQLKKIGASCDWSRKRFTLDRDYTKAVQTAFKHYYDKGYIYQGKRVVNWCPRCSTSLSDLELNYVEEKAKLYYIKYPLKDMNGFISVATVRPETMLGDAAVAVNPNDKRYEDMVGKIIVLPIVNREIPVISDNAIDSHFGTGAVKVTPAHDIVDFEISERHNLSIYEIIDEHGNMTRKAGSICKGKSVNECRDAVVEKLKELGLLEKVDDYEHRISKCDRCESVTEPILSLQWFVKMDKLSKLALESVKSGKVKFHPKRWEKVYFDWLENIKDWCVSRQLWWGHKIPIKGENDVLDTWFSSALWPFATMGWPDKTKDLKTYYPTDVLTTARDIINLWVARMIYSGLEFTGKNPFKDVYIHATVLTRQGRRMSKSLGTGIDPLDLIERYGADATRFGIIYQVMGGQDIHFTEDHIVAGKKFCNKVWNAVRFSLMLSEGKKFSRKLPRGKLSKEDKKIIRGFQNTAKKVSKDLQGFRFGPAAHTLYDFFWHTFCDKYIEYVKQNRSNKSQEVLIYVLANSIKLLHPFIPSITEELYSHLPLKNKQMLIVENWPVK